MVEGSHPTCSKVNKGSPESLAGRRGLEEGKLLADCILKVSISLIMSVSSEHPSSSSPFMSSSSPLRELHDEDEAAVTVGSAKTSLNILNSWGRSITTGLRSKS